MNKEVEEIIKLGKDSIIRQGLELIGDKADIENFAKIKVITNGKEVYVSFKNPIKYLPIKSVFYFDIEVSLIEKMTSYGPVSNGIDEYQNIIIPFFRMTEESKLRIQFIVEAINKSNEVGAFDIASFEDDMIIRENENYYHISIVSKSQESSYKIDKLSGKVYDTEHAHIEHSLQENEEAEIFIEII